jgi:hypothetical protein
MAISSVQPSLLFTGKVSLTGVLNRTELSLPVNSFQQTPMPARQAQSKGVSSPKPLLQRLAMLPATLLMALPTVFAAPSPSALAQQAPATQLAQSFEQGDTVVCWGVNTRGKGKKKHRLNKNWLPGLTMRTTALIITRRSAALRQAKKNSEAQS